VGNSEWPDLPFIPPRSWTAGRPAGQPTLVVVHYTAGSERPTSAEDGAAYDQRRMDGTSAHYYVDQDSVVQCVHTWDTAHSALWHGNRAGIQYELCGTRQTRAQWLDDASLATLRLAARQMRRDMAKHGIPAARLTPTQVRAGQHGVCGHADVTAAWPEDGGDHTDPGEEFPWDILMQLLRGDDDVLTDKQNAWLSETIEILRAFARGDESTWTQPVRAQAQLNTLSRQVARLVEREPAQFSPEQLEMIGRAAAMAAHAVTSERIAALEQRITLLVDSRAAAAGAEVAALTQEDDAE
jgi:hypothetical protein